MAIELPESMNIANQLNKEIVNKKIIDIDLSDKCKKLIEWGFTNLHERDIRSVKIKNVYAEGQYIYLVLNNHFILVFGDLIGKILLFKDDDDVDENYKIKIILSHDLIITFHTNLYGYACVLNEDEIKNHRYLGHNGITPLDKKFTYEYFIKMLEVNRTKLVKKIQNLYDFLIGFQNGYFQDIFYSAGILPFRKIIDLSNDEKIRLYECIINITKKSCALNGAVDEVDIYNNYGKYERLISKKNKDKPCPNCGSIIQQKNIMGSNSYFCTGCQK